MSEKDEWEKSLENEVDQCDDYLEKAKDISDLVPEVEQRKKEAQAKLLFVRSMPESILAERGHILFVFQKRDEEQLKNHLPGLSRISPETKRYMINGTSTSSEYFDIVQTYRLSGSTEPIQGKSTFPEVEPRKVEIVYSAFTELAQEKSKKQSLPPILNRLNKDLGDKFVVAQKNFEKAKSGIVGIDQSAIQMRDVLEQLWGGLVQIVRKQDPRKYKGVELNWNPRGKQIVIECLTDDLMDMQELARMLDIMTSIHSQISDTEFGKNPLTKDLEKLKNLYSQWLLVVSDIAYFIYIDTIFGNSK